MTRKQTSDSLATSIAYNCGRRCALCYGLKGDFLEKRGQLAHIDHNSSNTVYENLVWLCVEHHDLYDSKTSQTKNYTQNELKRYKTNVEFAWQSYKKKLSQNSEQQDYSQNATLCALNSLVHKLCYEYNDGYSIEINALTMCENISSDLFPLKDFSLILFKDDLEQISQIIVQIFNIFTPNFYHVASDKLVFNMHYNNDSVLESNKQLYQDFVKQLQIYYSALLSKIN